MAAPYPFLDSQVRAYMGEIKTVDPVEAVRKLAAPFAGGSSLPGKRDGPFFATGDRRLPSGVLAFRSGTSWVEHVDLTRVLGEELWGWT